ncbi:hypothetical protein CYMTET_36161 [Cymbomonas tetramitiformis]|uniref:Uncharacterized protein n=1 Tax=Cymbomonas tetramitiformis TaxID=36881 RepID=A0AAE0F795_9CHLO|nr:hypothetical protein CYMTET_36161 [Cymbomonas tetramitiformis]
MGKEHESPEEFNSRRKREVQWKYVVPLAYAPVLPLIRVGLRHNPPMRDKAFAAGILVALTHAGYIMFSDSTVL